MAQYCLTGYVKGDSDIPSTARVYITNWSPGFITAEIMGSGKGSKKGLISKSIKTTQLDAITYRKTPEHLIYKFLKIYNSQETAIKITSSFNQKVGSKSKIKAEFTLYSYNTQSDLSTLSDRTYHETLIVGVIAVLITLSFAWVEISPFIEYNDINVILP
ncbi:MAG: hypothetical protein OCD01_11060 [Fibrobacterales bacterium]